MTKPADLKIGDRIDALGSSMKVFKEPFVDVGEEAARRFGVEYRPDEDRVYIDVEVGQPSRFGDPDRLPEVTGAVDFEWLGSTPTLRYRLAFRPDADVAVKR